MLLERHMDRLTLDMRAAWRSLVTQRGATSAIVAVLGLGVGLVTAMFALADPFVMRPLPYPAPRQLVFISATPVDEHGHPVRPSGLMWSDRQIALPTVQEWKARRDLFQDLASLDLSAFVVVRLHPADRTIALRGYEVSRGMLRMLGQRDVPCQATAPSRCAMLTALTLRREFAGREELVGRWWPTSAGPPVQITGVLGKTFVFPMSYDSGNAVFLASEDERDDAAVSSTPLLARVQPGVSMAARHRLRSAPLDDSYRLRGGRVDEVHAGRRVGRARGRPPHLARLHGQRREPAVFARHVSRDGICDAIGARRLER
jgi:putative ABC transport system permease protein